MINRSFENIDIDLYQIRMLIGYYKAGLHKHRGAMEAFARKLPKSRRFFVVCGIERIMKYLNELKFTNDDIDIFEQVLPEVQWNNELRNYLRGLSFKDEIVVNAMTEGEIAFEQEPFIRLFGPIGMVQYVEKKILSILNDDIRVASKAARVVLAAGKAQVFEFGGRRLNDRAIPTVARAAYIAGVASTSSVAAFAEYGIPCSGTMGHVWVMSHKDEPTAFYNWSKVFPKSTYLIDTYNAYNGVDNAIRNANGNIYAIRIDSGDLAEQANSFRLLLNRYDHHKTKIFGSDDLNEYKIKEIVSQSSCFDGFGVGTEIVSTPDAPNCGIVYKLVEMEDESGVFKSVAKIQTTGKATYPCSKQVFRFKNERKNKFTHDIVGANTENFSNAEFLLFTRYPATWTSNDWPVIAARNYCQKRLAQMPDFVKEIAEYNFDEHKYSVEISEHLERSKAVFKTLINGK